MRHFLRDTNLYLYNISKKKFTFCYWINNATSIMASYATWHCTISGFARVTVNFVYEFDTVLVKEFIHCISCRPHIPGDRVEQFTLTPVLCCIQMLTFYKRETFPLARECVLLAWFSVPHATLACIPPLLSHFIVNCSHGVKLHRKR